MQPALLVGGDVIRVFFYQNLVVSDRVKSSLMSSYFDGVNSSLLLIPLIAVFQQGLSISTSFCFFSVISRFKIVLRRWWWLKIPLPQMASKESQWEPKGSQKDAERLPKYINK